MFFTTFSIKHCTLELKWTSQSLCVCNIGSKDIQAMSSCDKLWSTVPLLRTSYDNASGVCGAAEILLIIPVKLVGFMIDFTPSVTSSPGCSGLLGFFIVHWAGNDIKQVLRILERWSKAAHRVSLWICLPVSSLLETEGGRKFPFSLCVFKCSTSQSLCILCRSSAF